MASKKAVAPATSPDVTKGELGKGLDAAAITDQLLGQSPVFPVTIQVTNALPRTLVIAQAVPALVIESEKSGEHACYSHGQLYDVVFGIVATADLLDQEKIGTVTVVTPVVQGAS